MDLKSFLKEEDRGAHTASELTGATGADLLSFEKTLASFPDGRASGVGAQALDSSRDDPFVPAATPVATRSVWRRAGLWCLGLLLLASLQLAWVWRSVWWQLPWLVEAVQLGCARVACEVPAWRAPDFLKIDSSQFVRTDHGYQLEWTLRNLSSWPLRMPAMELVLTQDGGGVMVRRVITPTEMAAPDRLEPDESWDGVLVVEMRDALPVSGYRLLAFYP